MSSLTCQEVTYWSWRCTSALALREICAREMEKVPVLQRTGWAMGVTLDWSGKSPTTEVQRRTVQYIASRYSYWDIQVALRIIREAHNMLIYSGADNGVFCQLMIKTAINSSPAAGVEQRCHLQHRVVQNAQGLVRTGHIATVVIA